MPARKLTDRQVELIRELRAAGVNQTTLAQRFGVSQPLICNIANGKRRRTCGGPVGGEKQYVRRGKA